MIRVSIVGASGYAGGELLRLLLDHPQVEVGQVTSERQAGKFVHSLHPNLRGRTKLKFVPSAGLDPADVICLALPHGHAQTRIEEFAAQAARIVDLSADFRLRDLDLYEKTYGSPHQAPEWNERFVYGLPELNRKQLAGATHVSGVGCNATASNLALLPLVKAGLLDAERAPIVDLKVGSSEGGNKASLASHHPERSHVVRSFAPVGHRHAAEVVQGLGLAEVHLSVTSIELVRGVLATAHCWLKEPAEDKELWKVFRGAYRDEPFVRLVKDKKGVYRYPEPKLLWGTNFADVGWAVEGRRLVSICAIDNLMKGAAGTALQCLNLMQGWDESLGLSFPGLHPI
ncbi:MAG: N-acetyl-gamma-glutamyl-phosphate reductase [Planctomycetes bacterium]|nr:N-acetyl-gamma-glutamyl-phosphate reductase [Planctomycetota bacterium]